MSGRRGTLRRTVTGQSRSSTEKDPPARLDVLIVGLNFPPEPTGIAPYTAGTARFLVEAGHRVRVITGVPHYPQWRRSPGFEGWRTHETIGGIEVLRVAHPVPPRGNSRERIFMELAFAAHASSIRGRSPDVALAVSPSLLSIAGALRQKMFHGTPVGVIVHDLYGRAIAEAGALRGRGVRLAEILERSLLRRADGVVAIHDQFRDSLVSLGVEPTRISTIRNWSHIGSPTVEPRVMRRELGWAEDEIIALHAGNIGRKQGLENLAEAARLAERAGAPVRFVLLGSGNERDGLVDMARGLSCLDVIDPLPDGAFESALGAADVLVLNERAEVAEMCVPSKLTSYFAAGRPVLAATSAWSAATAEVIASGGGVCVPPGNPQAVVDGVLALSRNSIGARRMGERGRMYADAVLSEDAARTAYVAWVESLAGRVPPTPPSAMRAEDRLSTPLEQPGA